MPDRTSHPRRGRSRGHSDRSRGPRLAPAPRDRGARALPRNGEWVPATLAHGEDAGPDVGGAPPREERAG